jgi:hypothetical protein
MGVLDELELESFAVTYLQAQVFTHSEGVIGEEAIVVAKKLNIRELKETCLISGTSEIEFLYTTQ